MSAPATKSAPPLRCASWNEHEWRTPRLITSGNHPTMGAYQLFKIVCERCDGSRMETRWLHERSASTLFDAGGR